MSTYEFGESLGDLAEREDGLSADDQWLALVFNDALDRHQQVLGAAVAHRLEHQHLLLLGLRLLQHLDQLLQPSYTEASRQTALSFTDHSTNNYETK